MDMIDEQIQRRRERGLTDLKRIANQGSHPLLSSFLVTSLSGQAYRVRIRSLDELRNSCTCPDFRTNLVGTCKHIEGVLAQLRRHHRPQSLERLARRQPTAPEVYLHYGDEISVRLSCRPRDSPALTGLLERYFDAEGVLQGPLVQALPSLLHDLESERDGPGTHVDVADAVRDYLDLLTDREAIARQREWFSEELRRGHRSLSLLAAPLYEYQKEGALHLAFGRRAMLADDMGLGKTIQAIAAAVLLHQLRGIQRVLVICPASLKHQWAREISRFTDLSAQVIEGPGPRRRLLYASPAFFNMLNYELVLRDVDLIQRLRPDVIVLDEAQRIKNWRTKTADLVKRLHSPYGFVLTGTPLENRLDELYSIFQFLDSRILGPLWKFNERYFEGEKTGPRSFKIHGYKNLDELRRRIAPCVLRRTRDEVLKDLPERTDNNFFVELTPLQADAYEEYRARVAKLLSQARRRPLTPKERDILLRSLVRMRLICDALALHDPKLSPQDRERSAPKLKELEEILTDHLVDGDRKALVFSQWSGMLELVEPLLRKLGIGYAKLTGEVPVPRRGELIQRFFEDAGCRVFLSTDAGGTGLNLQAASLVINLELPWNPAVLEQRIGRVHRHGQSRSVQVVNLVTRGTIEERILDRLDVKRSVFLGVFGEGEQPAAIGFADVGTELVSALEEMLGEPDEAEPEVALEPPVVEASQGNGAGRESEAATHAAPTSPPPTTAPRVPTPQASVREAAGPPGAPRSGAMQGEPVPGGGREAGGADAPGGGSRAPSLTVDPAITLRTFTGRLVARYPGRILLVRRPPRGTGCGEGLLVVVDQEPIELRPRIEALMAEHWNGGAPPLLLMELEGYRAMTALLGKSWRAGDAEPEAYRAPCLPRDAEAPAGSRKLDEARRSAAEGARRLRLAVVVLAGGFPEEAARPLRESLGWGLDALLRLADGEGSGATPPPARTIQARLVEPGHLPPDLATRAVAVRELTAPPVAGEETDPLSAPTAQALVVTVRELLELCDQRLLACAM